MEYNFGSRNLLRNRHGLFDLLLHRYLFIDRELGLDLRSMDRVHRTEWYLLDVTIIGIDVAIMNDAAADTLGIHVPWVLEMHTTELDIRTEHEAFNSLI